MPQSVVGQRVHREIEGWEMIEILLHDLEQGIIDMIASDEFRAEAKDALVKSGRFGGGKCFPVAFVRGQFLVKVYTSVESAHSKDRMPEPFMVGIDLQAGEMRPDTEEVTQADVTVQRIIGLDLATAGDKIRLEMGIPPLVPTRNQDGLIQNMPGNHVLRQEDYAARFVRAKATVERKRLEREALAMSEDERERVLREGEARNQDAE